MFKQVCHCIFYRALIAIITDQDPTIAKAIRQVYEKRQFWVPCYLRDAFFVDMTMRGRNESINSYFEGSVNSNAT